MATQKGVIAPVSSRIKAFILDIFLLAMPLLYIATYVIMGTKEKFQESQVTIFVIWLIYGAITSLFFAIKAQTPGYKSQQIYLINLQTGKKADFFIIFLRYFIFIVGTTFIVGIFLCLFRKDRLNLHDLLTQTAPVIEKQIKC